MCLERKGKGRREGVSRVCWSIALVMVGGAAAQGTKAGWRRLGVIAEAMHGVGQWCAEAEREEEEKECRTNAGPAMMMLLACQPPFPRPCYFAPALL